MKFEMELDGQEEEFDQSERDELIADIRRQVLIADHGATVSAYGLSTGVFGNIDPAILTVLITISSSSSIVAAITGIVQILVERSRSRSQLIKVTIGNASIEMPQNADATKIEEMARNLAQYVSTSEMEKNQ